MALFYVNLAQNKKNASKLCKNAACKHAMLKTTAVNLINLSFSLNINKNKVLHTERIQSRNAVSKLHWLDHLLIQSATERVIGSNHT